MLCSVRHPHTMTRKRMLPLLALVFSPTGFGDELTDTREPVERTLYVFAFFRLWLLSEALVPLRNKHREWQRANSYSTTYSVGGHLNGSIEFSGLLQMTLPWLVSCCQTTELSECVVLLIIIEGENVWRWSECINAGTGHLASLEEGDKKGPFELFNTGLGVCPWNTTSSSSSSSLLLFWRRWGKYTTETID